MINQQTEKNQDGENISQKMELKFFIYMVIIFFALPLAIIQIPGVEKVGEAIISPFMKIIESGQQSWKKSIFTNSDKLSRHVYIESALLNLKGVKFSQNKSHMKICRLLQKGKWLPWSWQSEQ